MGEKQKITFEDGYGHTYTLEFSNEITIEEFHGMCVRLAHLAGYTANQISEYFGEATI